MVKLKANSKGLTIIETILVASLMSIMALTLYNAIANGLKVWDRAHKFLVEEDIALFLDDIAHDLHNSVVLSNMLFIGQEDAIAFPAVLQVPEDPTLHPVETRYTHQIGRVRYYFDRLTKDVYRQDANYSLALQNKYLRKRSLVHALRDVKFKYYTVKEERLVEIPETQSWPAMIKIIVHYEGARGQESVMEKTVVLPMHSTGNV